MQDKQYVVVAGNIGDIAFFEECVARYCQNKTIFVIPGPKDTSEKYPQTPIAFGVPNIVPLSNPSMIDIGGIYILLTSHFDVSMLRKRYLGSGRSVTEEDDLVLDAVPDIVCAGSRHPQIYNYKSITVASSGSMMSEFRPVVIDLLTREANAVQVMQ
jgi:DNA polymerase II small subunit/DNA polymerase delta subunit B